MSKIENKKQPKDFAEKNWIKFQLEAEENDWQEVNKEGYLKIAKYLLFGSVASAWGYLFLLALLS